MRSIVMAVALIPAAATVAHSQQAQTGVQTHELAAQSQPALVADSAAAPNVRLDAPIGITRAQARMHDVESNQLTKTTAPTVDSNTRNTLAIVGAVVIVLALIAFLL
jgi:hypothetical protein